MDEPDSCTRVWVTWVGTMIRRKINIVCLQETKWAGEKANEIETTGYKIIYTGIDRQRNEVRI